MELRKDEGGFGYGSVWDSLGVSVEGVLERIQEALDESGVSVTVKHDRNGILRFHPTAVVYHHDLGKGRTSYVFLVDEDSKNPRFVGLFPDLQGVSEYPVAVEHSMEWHSRVEARVVGSICGMPITWFDPDYALRWPDYIAIDPGDVWNVSFAALAESISVAKNQTFKVPAEKFAAKFGMEGDENGEIEYTTKGAAILLPSVDGWPDIYQFSGTVRSIVRASIAGVDGWVAEVCVLRFDEDIFFPIYFAAAALDGALPEVGDDVTGQFWLQWRLVSPVDLDR